MSIGSSVYQVSVFVVACAAVVILAVDANAKKPIIYFDRAAAFEPFGNMNPTGRLVKLNLSTESRLQRKGEKINIAVTVQQTSSGASGKGNWRVVIGDNSKKPVVLIHLDQGSPVFQPGSVSAKAVATRTDEFGLVLETWKWESNVSISR